MFEEIELHKGKCYTKQTENWFTWPIQKYFQGWTPEAVPSDVSAHEETQVNRRDDEVKGNIYDAALFGR